MFTKALILALAAASTTVAQTHTDCDPREKRCPAAPALAKSVDIDFTKSKGDEYLHTLDGTKVEYDGEKGAIFSIANENQAPTKASDDYIFFGELHCEVQASPGKGIVTSIVLQSDDLDEIDWEWVGADNEQVQTNYFGKGDDGTYDRGGFHDVANPTGQFHNYGIIWTQEKIDWTIDGQVIRTLTYEEAKGGSKYPQSPMQIKIGTWTAGNSKASPGTVEWAGGLADFKNGGPYIGYYKNCKIVDYMGGKSAATEYAYPDGYDGRWENVIIKNDGSKSDEDESSSKTTKTASATKSAASAESSSEAATTTTVESSSAETTAASSSAEESDAVSESEAETSGSAATPTDDSDAPSGTSDESTEESDEPAAGMMVQANMALGAAGLIAAFFM